MLSSISEEMQNQIPYAETGRLGKRRIDQSRQDSQDSIKSRPSASILPVFYDRYEYCSRTESDEIRIDILAHQAKNCGPDFLTKVVRALHPYWGKEGTTLSHRQLQTREITERFLTCTVSLSSVVSIQWKRAGQMFGPSCSPRSVFRPRMIAFTSSTATDADDMSSSEGGFVRMPESGGIAVEIRLS
jgi:hypothetical protein